MLAEETYCIEKAASWGNERFAGLFYAPWIYEEVILNEKDTLETLFFLLILESPQEYSVYVNYFIYTSDHASTPILCKISGDQKLFRFSVHPAENIWDDDQWGEEYLIDEAPLKYRDARLERTVQLVSKMMPLIDEIVRAV